MQLNIMKQFYFFSLFLFSSFIYAQNTCQDAINISLETVYHVNTIDGNPAPTACTSGNLGNVAEWYVFTAPQDMEIMVTSNLTQNQGQGIDTNFYVYTGSCANLVCLSGDDDSGIGYLSVKTFNVIANTTYYIVWDNRWQINTFDFLV